ncbi:hypothetical protein A4X13_0g1162 [Tilletia indica]|uniref:Uncharacterized protein n=1 Tax=Tilletia indica TaxID=43049 RepID=A0A177TNP0_9BASI|nr:hypothetical protein A4X13_0g1162 [Tilletia indica]
MTSHRLTRFTLATPAATPTESTDPKSAAVAQENDDLLASSLSTDPPELYDSVRNSRTVEDFTRFVSELRLNRQASRSTLPGTPLPTSTSSNSNAAAGSGAGAGGGAPSSSHTASSADDSASTISDEHHPHSHHTPSSSRHYDDDNASILDDVSIRYGFHPTQNSSGSTRPPVSVRCTCCCNKADCERATRAMSEWAALEEDLRLAAEIGQSLLHKHDAAVGALSKAQDEHVQQRDSLMNRLTHSIRESAGLQRQLTQTTLNLEAADASNRTLLSELDEARSASKTLKRSQARLGIVEKHIEKLTRESDDARAEAVGERKRAEAAEARAKKLAARLHTLTDKLDFAKREAELMAEKAASPSLGEDAIREARERLQLSLAASSEATNGNGDAGAVGEDDPLLIELRAEVDSLTNENARLKEEGRQASAALEAAKEEVSSLRESLQEHTLSISPGVPGSSRRTLNVGSTAPQLRKASGASISTAFSDTYSIPVSRGSFADRSDVEYDVDEISLSAAAPPIALSDEVVTRDLQAPPPHTPTAATFPTSTSSDAGSVVTDSSATNRAASSMVMSPTTTSASTFETLATPTTEDNGGVSLPMGIGLTSPVKAPSIRSQGSHTHRRSGSVASSLRGMGGGIAPSASSVDGSSPSLTAIASGSTLPPSGTGLHPGSAAAGGPGTQESARDTRTAQLSNLLEYVSRIYNRLVSADIDTLHRRLQRQHLAGGDVGHLARTTVNSIVRDVDALRAHFRKLTEAEQRAMLLQSQQQQQQPNLSGGGGGASTESLVVRRDFFALLKMFQNLFAETARLRACVNEIHLQPSGASKILNEHLGLSLLGPGNGGAEGGGGSGSGGLMSGGWLARMLGSSGSTAGGSGAGNNGLPVTPGVGGLVGATPFGPGPSPSPAAAAAGSAAAGATSPVIPTLGSSRTNSSISVLGTPTGDGPVPLPNVAAVTARSSTTTGREGMVPSASATRLPTTTRAAAPAVAHPSTVAVEVKASVARGGGTSMMPASESVGNAPAAAAAEAVPRPNPNLGRSTLTRTQSRNLSGIFVGAGKSASTGTGSAPLAGKDGTTVDSAPLADESWDVVSQADAGIPSGASQRQSIFFRSGVGASRARPLSRIVDDDEISIHQGRRGFGGGAGTSATPGGGGGGQDEDDYQRFTSAARAQAGSGPGGVRTLHRRGLSDSSMHSTFLEQGQGGDVGGGGGSGGGGPSSRNGAGGRQHSAAGLLVRGSAGAGGGAGNGPLRTSPMSRIITPATLSLHVSSSASGRTSAQFARSMSVGNASKAKAVPTVVPAQAQAQAQTTSVVSVANWSLAPSSPSISEDSAASFSTGGGAGREKRSGSAAVAAAAASGPRGLMPTLRAAPSAVALLFPGAGTARTASASSSLSATNAEGGVSSSSTSPGKGGGGLS